MKYWLCEKECENIEKIPDKYMTPHCCGVMMKELVHATPEVLPSAELNCSLRDYFAAHAMAAIIIGNNADICTTGREGSGGAAKDAYIVADSMLKARGEQ